MPSPDAVGGSAYQRNSRQGFYAWWLLHYSGGSLEQVRMYEERCAEGYTAARKYPDADPPQVTGSNSSRMTGCVPDERGA